MKINYFQKGGGAEEIAKAYQLSLILNNVADKLNEAGFKTESVGPGMGKLLAVTKAAAQPTLTYSNPLFKSALNEAWWLKQANDATGGLFKTVDDIIAWQKANGLVADGKFGKNSIAKWNALNPKPVPAASAEDKSLDLMIQAGEKLAANKLLRLTSNLFSGIQSGITTENQYPAMLQTENRNNTIRLNADIINRRQNPLQFYAAFKQGGQINYFQQGGQMQQDPVGQVIQGLLQDPQGTMQALSQMQGQQGGKEQVNAILQEIVKRAKSGDQQAAQAIQVLQQAMQGGQLQAQQAPMAKNGAKLNYLKQLKGKCPEGEELVYMKKGGTVCPVCQKKKDGGEAKAPKKQYFGKDKKVAKAQEGGDTAKISKKVTAKGDTITTEKYPNRLIQTFSPSGIVRDSTASGISIYNPNLMPVGGMLVSPSDSIKYENILKQPAKPIYKQGGKTQFFKKQQKAPIAKCGSKMKTDKCGGKMKAKKK